MGRRSTEHGALTSLGISLFVMALRELETGAADWYFCLFMATTRFSKALQVCTTCGQFLCTRA